VTMEGETVHATALVLGEAGILVRGPSGAGKTSLALALIARARGEGRFARLVADDRVGLRVRGGRILLLAPARIAGLAECRGAGIRRLPHLDAAVLRLVVDLDADAPRFPEPEARAVIVQGVDVPRLVTRLQTAVEAVLAMIEGGLVDASVTE
jgi:HPr kinase/phosphorylase